MWSCWIKVDSQLNDWCPSNNRDTETHPRRGKMAPWRQEQTWSNAAISQGEPGIAASKHEEVGRGKEKFLSVPVNRFRTYSSVFRDSCLQVGWSRSLRHRTVLARAWLFLPWCHKSLIPIVCCPWLEILYWLFQRRITARSLPLLVFAV